MPIYSFNEYPQIAEELYAAVKLPNNDDTFYFEEREAVEAYVWDGSTTLVYPYQAPAVVPDVVTFENTPNSLTVKPNDSRLTTSPFAFVSSGDAYTDKWVNFDGVSTTFAQTSSVATVRDSMVNFYLQKSSQNPGNDYEGIPGAMGSTAFQISSTRPAATKLKKLDTSPFDVGTYTTDNPRWNIASATWIKYWENFFSPHGNLDPPVEYTLNYRNSYAIRGVNPSNSSYTYAFIRALNQIVTPSGYGWSTPTLKLHSPTPILVGEATGTTQYAGNNVNIRWSEASSSTREILPIANNATFTGVQFYTANNQGKGNIRARVYTRGDSTEYMDSIGHFRMTIERLPDANGLNAIPEKWMRQDSAYFSSGSDSFWCGWDTLSGPPVFNNGGFEYNGPVANGNFENVTSLEAAAPYKVTWGDKLRIRLYEYPL